MASSAIDCAGGEAGSGDAEGGGEGGERPTRRDARIVLPTPERARSEWAVQPDGAHDDAHGRGAPCRAAVDAFGRLVGRRCGGRRDAGLAAEAQRRAGAFRGAPTTALLECPRRRSLSAHDDALRVPTTTLSEHPRGPVDFDGGPVALHASAHQSATHRPQVPSQVSLYYHAAPNAIEVLNTAPRARSPPRACKCSPRRHAPPPHRCALRTWCPSTGPSSLIGSAVSPSPRQSNADGNGRSRCDMSLRRGRCDLP